MRVSYIKQSECLSALRRDERLSARPVGGFIEALLQFKQSVVFVGVGQKLSALVSVKIFFLEKEVHEIPLLYSQLFCRVSEVGQEISLHQLVKVVGFGLHYLIFHLKLRHAA